MEQITRGSHIYRLDMDTLWIFHSYYKSTAYPNCDFPGIFWKGYRDCGRWFARAPDTSESCCGKGRKVEPEGIWRC